ncbi:16S rRNA (cytosine(1402)-N(4))-methyltransferase RsmH [bacterium]|nr:16S rRNA (cytosine(1402)-N(4))-methyltransferase RsmH [bacterium]MBU1652745.1 16S rRNA (cytosine(1402)-N(4))-methyltransferase RsmH [bacterium]MBU1882312.1 16S rRNA (cytosine(1402)-N(4))-methyltransferase RsmH [bacterium]
MQKSADTSAPEHNAGGGHQPVMLDQVIDLLLQSHPEQKSLTGTIVDGTTGAGGHSLALLKHLEPNGSLLCFDRDPAALTMASRRMGEDSRVTTIQSSYADLARHCAPETVSAALLDLGLSTDQLNSERGFAFRRDTPLDMRFDPAGSVTAAGIVNHYTIEKLRDIFFQYGEEPLSPRIARRIAEKRSEEKIETSSQLLAVIREAVPERFYTKTAARIFQALRIAVNDEIEHFENGLIAAWEALRIGGVLCVISYHSIEDRRMKRFVAEMVKGCTCPPQIPICVCGKVPTARKLTKSALRPTGKEMRLNPRSRSARLRAAMKIA